jgi:hypothetical protein
MGLVVTERHGRLRFGVGVSGIASREMGAVLVWDDIPIGSLVHARVMQPTELNTPSDGGAGATTPRPAKYAFERAPLPGPLAFAGYTPLVGGATRAAVGRTQARLLGTDGKGGVTPVQPIPVFAAFPAPQTGSLFQLGRANHSLQMRGVTGDSPALKPADRDLLRLRWTGTAVVGEVVTALDPATGAATPPDGTLRSFAGQLAGRSVAPGSFSMVVSDVGGAALTVRDDGNGRISGFRADANGNIVAQGDGLIVYEQGTFTIRFGTPTGGFPTAAAAATMTAGYEKDCLYLPLDVQLGWDAQEQ